MSYHSIQSNVLHRNSSIMSIHVTLKCHCPQLLVASLKKVKSNYFIVRPKVDQRTEMSLSTITGSQFKKSKVKLFYSAPES